MNERNRKFWIGVASKDHVAHGVALGMCQFCHGKASPAKRLVKGDFVIYYSSKHAMDGRNFYQKFTAIGTVTDEVPYQVEMGDGFAPYRRNIKYLAEAKHLAIRPMIPVLPFIKNKKSWGYAFRFGFFEIDPESFALIAKGMLGFDPLL